MWSGIRRVFESLGIDIDEDEEPLVLSPELMTELGPLGEGLNQPSPDASTRSFELEPSIG